MKKARRTGLTDKPQFSTECARSAQCSGYKSHFDECVERVTAMHEDPDYKGPHEDCVEECKAEVRLHATTPR